MPRTPAVFLLALLQSAAANGAQQAQSLHLPPWLVHLGLPGLGLISFLNAALVSVLLPGSGDLLLLFLAAEHAADPVVLTLIATVASGLGGYTTWKMGQVGGEPMLQHFAPRRLLKPMNRWMRSHGFLTIATSAVLPPPLPLAPLLLGAGALGASVRHFLFAFGLGRLLRFGLTVWLGEVYGGAVLQSCNLHLVKWSGIILWTTVAIMVGATLFGIWQFRKSKRAWDLERARPRAEALPQN